MKVMESPQEVVYVSIRRDERWDVLAIDHIDESHLSGVDLARDFHATLVICRDETAACRQLEIQR